MSAGAPEAILFGPDATMPNSRLPVLLYRGGLGEAQSFEELFRANGWHGIWRNGVFDYDHYHSNAHEALGVASGHAELQLGGASGEAIFVEAGDALVLPAGTGHRRNSASRDFVMIGAYPPGQERYNVCRSRDDRAEKRIEALALPRTDPVRGRHGPLLELWLPR